MTRSFLPAVLVTTLSITFLVQDARAVSFDAIIPSLIQVDTNNAGGSGGGGFGWIVATSDTISLADLDGSVLTASTTGPVTTDSQVLFNNTLNSPLAPGQVSGPQFGSSSFNNSVFGSLLNGNETLVNPSIPSWNFGFSYAPNYTGTETLSGSLRLGDQLVEYTTQVQFGSFPDLFQVESAQRLSSVPEPSTALLLATGLLGFAGVRRGRA